MLKKGFLFFLFFLLTFVCIGCFGDGGPLGVSVRSDSVNTGFGSYNKATKKISVGLGQDTRELKGSGSRDVLKNELGLDWYYTWNWEQADFMGNDTSVEFVPMMGRLVDYEKKIDIIKRRQPYPHFILLANEPYLHLNQLTSQQAKDEEAAKVNKVQLDTLERLVKEFPDSNVVKIGSPGIAWGIDGYAGLSNFMVAVNADPDKYRIDFTAFHFYGLDYNVYLSIINEMFRNLKYQGRDLKIWMTEFGPAYDAFTTEVYTPAQTQVKVERAVNEFLPEFIYKLNREDRLERYSWWSYPIILDPNRVTSVEHLRIFTNSGPGSQDLILTPLGKVYAKYIKDPPTTRPTRAETQPGGRYGFD